jgi:hypothetical protein
MLRCELVETRGKLAKVQEEYKKLESSHSHRPYWVQTNKSLPLASNDRCENLEKENEKLHNMFDELKAENKRL